MNARNNSDKLCNSEATYNAIHSVEDITGSGTITEPVSLQEAKDYLRLETFTFDDDSPADEFDFDDALVSSMITEARMWCEQYLGGEFLMVGLIPRTIEVWLTNGAGPIRIPGPVTSALSDITFADKNGNAVTSEVFWMGATFPKLDGGFSDRVKLVYDAGYDVPPEWVKNAILAYVVWAYEHRGDEDQVKGSPERAAAICRPYRRIKLFA